MPFLYEFYLNKTKLTGIETGFSTSRKWEEALDEAKLSIPFYDSDIPFSQYGLLEIEITEVDNYTDLNEIATETFVMLVISDRVSLSSNLTSVYRHDISAIEYTGKLDAYIMASLAKTRSIENKLPAKFEITTDGAFLNQYSGLATSGTFNANVWLPPFTIMQTYYVDKVYTFLQVAQAYQVIEDSYDGYGNPYARRPTLFRIYNIGTSTYSNWYDISADNVEITFTSKGKYYIEYGLSATTWKTDITTAGYTATEYAIYRFYFSVIDEYQVTIYDVVNSVRQNVSKGGGIESLLYFDDTRIFDIDPTIETYLKSVPAPQMYLEKATARQMLIFALSYINSLPRLEYGEVLDTLKIEQFNLSTGTFSEQDVMERSSSQNINQIGSRSYAPLSQALPNDMDEATMFSPSQDGFQQVRATDLQITDSTFEIKLPKEIYTPKEFVVLVPMITIDSARGVFPDVIEVSQEFENLEIPLTSRTINIEEWKLKYITDNFPTTTTKLFWDSDLGLRTNMVDNIYWEMGAKKIKVSEIYGTLVNKTLIQNVVKLGIYEYLMLNMPTPFTYTYDSVPTMYWDHNITIDLDFLTDATLYKDLRFRFSYLTLQDLVTKGDKEDLSQINFYSEMRQNQDESIINVVRSSRKNYGDLQRTGNVTFSFQKMHHSLSEQYAVGMKDINNYTVTTVNRDWFPYYFIATYFVTKYYNRESRQTIVDQTYRWRDNYAKNVLNRHEHYSDYIYIFPPNDIIARADQVTKIYTNSRTVKTIVAILLGETITDYKTKATVALIRTDGMFESVPETAYNYYSLAVPVSSYPLKQGFAFTFGFENNQVAGDGLVERGSGNWYNQAVRYTDENGRFTQLGFIICSGLELDSDDYETYPKITRDTLLELHGNRYPYFSCGSIAMNDTGIDSLVVDKDPMTNYNQTYQVNVLSYYVGLYILGQAFYNNNFIVNNPSEDTEAYLYLYTDGTKYELFEDLKIKSGYSETIKLDDTKIEYNDLTNIVSFTDLIDFDGDSIHWVTTTDTTYQIWSTTTIENPTSQDIMNLLEVDWPQYFENLSEAFSSGAIYKVTDGLATQYWVLSYGTDGVSSWAIGDIYGNLYIACNERLNGFSLSKTHFRLNIKEIGDKDINPKVIDVYDGHCETNLGISITATGRLAYGGSANIDLGISIRAYGMISSSVANLEFGINFIANGYKSTDLDSSAELAFGIGIEASGEKSTDLDGGTNLEFGIAFSVTAEQEPVYEIAYVLYGGTNSGSNPSTFSESNLDIPLYDATRSGYEFGGWFTSSSYTTPIYSITSVGNKTIYAKWYEVYNISYSLDGGTNNESNVDTFTINDLDVMLYAPTKTDYQFDGWYNDTPSLITEITTTGDITVYAHWTLIDYNITYTLNGGTNNESNVDTFT
ncbi:MAG: InlB B-repeat-containing protein, partial [Clostridia bacterium]|nr:InlB B-repeat-containing protein [Clostridia bacterium]